MYLSSDNYLFKWWHFYVIMCLFGVLFYWMSNHFILTDSFYFSSFSGSLDIDKIESLIQINKKFQWIGYIGIPLAVLLKWVIIAFVIYTGLVFFTDDATYDKCFKIVQLAEVIFVIVGVTKMAWFIIYPPHSIEEVQNFFPLSITNLLDMKNVASYMVYPLQQLNLFEALYILILSLGISSLFKIKLGKALKITVLSYGSSLVLWIMIIMFLQMQMG